MEEFFILVLLPSSIVVLGVKNLRMVELFGSDLRKPILNLYLPFIKEVSLRETFDKLTDPIVSDGSVSDHLLSYLKHFVIVPCKISTKSKFIASRGKKIDKLASA